MSSLDSLISKLSPLGIYKLTENSNIYAELCAYGVGLDLLREEHNIILRESFAETAESYGLERQERMWGAVRDDLDTETRRRILLARLTYGEGDFTLEDVSGVLAFLGVTGTVYEYPHICRIVVDLSSQELSHSKRVWVKNQLEAFLPAHLETDAVFAGLTWADSDLSRITFETIEAKKYTWAEIDLLG